MIANCQPPNILLALTTMDSGLRRNDGSGAIRLIRLIGLIGLIGLHATFSNTLSVPSPSPAISSSVSTYGGIQ